MPELVGYQGNEGQNGPGIPHSQKDQAPYFWVHAYRSYLVSLGYGLSSVQMLPACLGEFLDYCQKAPQSVESQDILAYRNHLQTRPNRRRAGGLSERYIHHHLYALRVFFDWQVENGQLAVHPMSGLRFAAPRSKPREVLTLSEVQALYHACESPRERAILSLCYGCGLRRSEAERLDIQDLDLANRWLIVRQGKGKQRRVVPMSERVGEDLKSYLTARSGQPWERALLLGRTGKRLSGSRINDCLKAILARTEIQKAITLHSLRHSIATHLLQSGMSVEYVRDFLGHKHLEATQVYTRVDDEMLRL